MDLQSFVADGQVLLVSLIAFAAGLISFASPCVLPLVPGYLAYVSGIAGQPSTAAADPKSAARSERRRMVVGSFLFIGGFSLVFVLLLALAGTVGTWLLDWENVVTRIMGVVVIVMGLVFMGTFSKMQGTKKLNLKPRVGLAGAPILGVVFAIGWAPCMGPTLAVIMSLGLQSGTVGRSVVLGIAYCLGLGLPFFLAAFGFGWMTQTMTFFKRHMRTVNIIGGAILIVIGLLMVTGIWSMMMFALQAVIGGYVTPL